MGGMGAPTSGPSVSSSGPANNPNGRYYYEVYVWQDPSWNLVNSGWLDASQGTSTQGYGAGSMAAAQFNTQAQTRVWDQDTGQWLGWQTTGSVPQDAAGNPVAASTPAAGADVTPVLVVGGIVIAGFVAWAVLR
jgi:hypothetical protein